MIDCDLILSLSLILFSIMITSWWSFLTVAKNLAPDHLIANNFAGFILDHTHYWLMVVLLFISFTAVISGAYLLTEPNTSTNLVKLLIDVSFIFSLVLFAFHVFSHIFFVRNLARS